MPDRSDCERECALARVLRTFRVTVYYHNRELICPIRYLHYRVFYLAYLGITAAHSGGAWFA